MTARSDAAAFVDDPLGWAPADRIAPLLAPGLRPDTVNQLRRSPRLRRHASAVLAEQLGSGSIEALPPEDRRLVLASAAEISETVSAAGAICHAPRVRNLVVAREIAAFVDRHGEAARDGALRHRAPAPRHVPPRHVPGPPQGELDADIARDGAACMAIWINGLPSWAAARVRLKWSHPAGTALDEVLHRQAVAVVREAAALACAP